MGNTSRGTTWPRIVAGFLAGAVTAAAPFVYYWRLDWRPLQDTGVSYFSLLLGPVLAGGLVCALVSAGRSSWRSAAGLGAGLGAALGVAAAGFYFSEGGDIPQEVWLQVLLSLCFVALGAVVALVGGVLGWGCARTITGGSKQPRRRGLEPWQVGAALVVVAVIVFGAFAASAG
jgi:hypothetical protein